MTAFDTLIAAIGTGRIGAFYHRSVNCVAAGGNLVTWDDVRGSVGFGPQLLPNGGAGGTAPTVDANYVVTNGADSYVRHASALGMFDQRNSAALTIVLWGELAGSPTYWPLVIDSDAGGDLVLLKRSSTKITTFLSPTNNPAAKVFPASGVRSLLFMSMPKRYAMSAGDPGGSGKPWFLDYVGRGPLIEAHGPYTASTGYLSLGKYSTAFGSIKIRGCLVITDALRYADRAAIETFVTDVSVGDNVALYSESDSKGLIMCIGDSLTHGLQSSAPSVTVPVATAGTGYPSHLQSRINTAAQYSIDVINRGLPSMLGTEAATPLSGHTTSYVQDVAAMFSPGRRAAGFKDIGIIWFGANDIDGSVTAVNMEAALQACIDAVHAAGAKAVICTVIPLKNWFGTGKETVRKAVNTWIRANSAGADLVIDFTLLQNGATFPFRDPVGADNVTTDTTYYNADGIHGNDLSYGLEGDYIYDAINAAQFFPDPVASGGQQVRRIGLRLGLGL